MGASDDVSWWYEDGCWYDECGRGFWWWYVGGSDGRIWTCLLVRWSLHSHPALSRLFPPWASSAFSVFPSQLLLWNILRVVKHKVGRDPYLCRQSGHVDDDVQISSLDRHRRGGWPKESLHKSSVGLTCLDV